MNHKLKSLPKMSQKLLYHIILYLSGYDLGFDGSEGVSKALWASERVARTENELKARLMEAILQPIPPAAL
jgi:hypothetical protein